MAMKIRNRSGELEDVKFDKVTARIEGLSSDLSGVSSTFLAQKVLANIRDGINTSEIDEITADISASQPSHIDYYTLAGRILVSNIQKNTPSFPDAMKLLHEDGILVNYNPAILQKVVIYPERDNLIDFFGLKTLVKMYLTRNRKGDIMETPQYMFMRVAMAICKNDHVATQETYDAMSQKYYIHATPTLFNAGTNAPQLSSCFLVAMKEDSIDGIYDTKKDCARISKMAGGIGLHIHNIRSKGAKIKGNNGTSDGILPMLRTLNADARYVNQGGRRKGSYAIYLSPDHADIMEFLDIRLNQGDEEARCRDLFPALWIPDLFMKCVENDSQWALFDPSEAPGLCDVYGDEYEKLYNIYVDEGRAKKMLPASTVWKAIIRSQIETGTPYMLYKDACNHKTNQKNLGTIKSSNLCVAPETPILTKNGYKTIASLVNQSVEVWNGTEWSSVIIRKTSDDSELIRVETDTGTFLECTPEHKFWIKNDYYQNAIEVPAKDLTIGDKLVKFECEPIEFGSDDFKYPYTHGFFCGDGTYGKNYSGDADVPMVFLYGAKIDLLPHLNIRTTSGKITKENRLNCTLHSDMPRKFQVPSEYSIKVRLDWLSGLLDADGTYQRSGSVQLSSIHKDFLYKIQLMLHTLGVQSKITKSRDSGQRMLPKNDGSGESALFNCQTCWRMCISQTYVNKLVELGLNTYRLNTKNATEGNRKANWFPKIESVTWSGRRSPTYCFTEPKKHLGVFNGILTGQCTEIIEHSDSENTAVCNLASIGLPSFITSKYFDYKHLEQITRLAVRNLNKVIDISQYPIDSAKNSNMSNRPIGIGVQGLADVYAILDLDFGETDLNKLIFETIYYAAISESVEIAKLLGPYDNFQGSPASKGLFQFDLWYTQPTDRYDWETLRSDMMKYGLRNSLLIAPMPTASTSQILGFNECFEPFTTNLYLRRTLAGEFVVVNKYLVRDLMTLSLWNNEIRQMIIRNNGSIQTIDIIPEVIKRKYKTVWEISQRKVIDLAAERGPYICQSQSMNLFMADPSIAKISSMHLYAWKSGLKTGMYYLRTRPKANPIQFTVEPPPCTMCSS